MGEKKARERCPDCEGRAETFLSVSAACPPAGRLAASSGPRRAQFQKLGPLPRVFNSSHNSHAVHSVRSSRGPYDTSPLSTRRRTYEFLHEEHWQTSSYKFHANPPHVPRFRLLRQIRKFELTNVHFPACGVAGGGR